MKREKVISVAVTEDEYKEIMKRMGDSISQLGANITLSTFIRDHFIIPQLNGSPPEIPAEKTEDSISKSFEDIEF